MLGDGLDPLHDFLHDAGRDHEAALVVEQHVLLARAAFGARHLGDRVERPADVGHPPLAADLALRGVLQHGHARPVVLDDVVPGVDEILARRAQRCPWGDTGQRAPLRFTTMPTM